MYIWDLNEPTKPYAPTPGARVTKLDEITSLAWNQQVQYVLAGASSPCDETRSSEKGAGGHECVLAAQGLFGKELES